MKKSIYITGCMLLLCSLFGCKKSASALNSEGLEKFKSGDIQAAVKDFSEACKSDGDISAYSFNYALALNASAEYEKAVESLKKSIAKEKDAANLSRDYALLGDWYLAMGNNDDAIKAYENYVNLSYKDIEVYINTYEKLVENGLSKTANSLLEQFKGKKPSNAREENLYGLREYYLKNYDKASEYYEKAIKNKNKEALINLACIKSIKQDYEKALELIDSYEKSDKITSYSSYLRMEVNMGLERYDKAIEAAKKGLSLTDREYEEDILKNLVSCYENVNDYQAAYDTVVEFLAKYKDELLEQERIFLESRK